MFKKALNVLGPLGVAMALSAASAQAKTVVVGDPSCNPGPLHFTKIQDAVSAVTAVPDGSTILVCPGIYPEQVVITRPLTLKGIANGNLDAAVITVPAGGLVQNAVSPAYGPIAAQLLVQNTVGDVVRIQKLTVDGKGGTCPAGVNRTVGIQLLNVGGDPSWNVNAGFVQNSVVRNERNGCTPPPPPSVFQFAGGTGTGIASENSYVTISSNEIHDVDLEALTQTGGTALITNNNVQNAASGINLYAAVNDTITLNTLSSARGIDVDALSTANNIASNVIGPFVGSGVFSNGASGNIVKNNQINASFYGIVILFGGGNTVTGNYIANAGQNGLELYGSTGGNSIQNNTVNEAAIGFFLGNNGTSVDVITPNTFNSVTQLTN